MMNLLENLTNRISGSYRVKADNEHSSDASNGYNNEQGQIELVEKILNQISLHQSTTSSQSASFNNKANFGSIGDKSKNYYSRKIADNQLIDCNVNNYGHMARSKMSPMSKGYHEPSTSFEEDQCSQCEYYFIDGQIVPKSECTHMTHSKSVPKVSISSVERFSIKPGAGKLPFNRNKPNVVHSDIVARVQKPMQSIIQNNNCDVKNFVEAQIVFDHNNIDVVPVGEDTEKGTHNLDKTEEEPVKKFETEVTQDKVVLEKKVDNVCEDKSICDVKTTTTTNLSPQAVKKIKCLIANFITIQVDEDEDLSHEDILSSIDFEKLGFQNFDGKNIGLYKNIGYINRNKSKFVQPTKELLNLLLRIKNAPDKSKKERMEDIKVTHIDVSEFYDYVDPRSYVNKFAYSILDSLANSDDNLMRQLRTCCYRYPDCEYSSDCDEYLANYDTVNNHGVGKYICQNNIEDSYSDNMEDSNTMENAAKSASMDHGQYHRSIGGRNKRHSLMSETPNGSNLYHQKIYLNSYYITEVSFSETI